MSSPHRPLAEFWSAVEAARLDGTWEDAVHEAELLCERFAAQDVIEDAHDWPASENEWLALSHRADLEAALIATGREILDHRDISRSRAFPMVEQIIGLLSRTAATDREVLRLAGSYRRRRWMLYGRHVDLRLALHYYANGFGDFPAREEGVFGRDQRLWAYHGVLAAYVLDIMAAEEDQHSIDLHLSDHHLHERSADADKHWTDEAATDYRRRAEEIRMKVLDELEPLIDRWEPETSHELLAETDASAHEFKTIIGEAHFGLAQYEQAAEWFGKVGHHTGPMARILEEMARRLVRLVQYQPSVDKKAAFFAIKTLLDRQELDDEIAESMFAGRWGLALSGGGFRAALYHVGVLGALAEADLLRHMQVLSCVSGGSIVGALYYLKLRRFMMECPDTSITPEHYLTCIEEVAESLTGALDFNFRSRLMTNFFENLRMIFATSSSPTTRLESLLDQKLYADAAGQPGTLMSDIRITPDGNKAFKPRHDNWSRVHKIPILAINATSLNTGHLWEFTSRWMGEQDETVESAIDATRTMKRKVFRSTDGDLAASDDNDATVPAPSVSKAVAASAAVPGAFDPVSFENLYDAWTVRLVDGGVHDNQGVSVLLDEECDVIVVSDASSQLQPSDRPTDNRVTVPFRSNTILMQRVRAAQFADLHTREEAGQIRRYAFVHIADGLHTDPAAAVTGKTSDPANPETPYGVATDLQYALSQLRTDLDTFSEVEALALMTSGYLTAKRQIDDKLAEIAPPRQQGDTNRQPSEPPWRRSDVIAALAHPEHPRPSDDEAYQLAAKRATAHRNIVSHLELGRRRFGRWLQPMSHAFKRVPYGLLLAVALLVLAGLVTLYINDVFSIMGLVTAIGIPTAFIALLASLGGLVSLAIGLRLEKKREPGAQRKARPPNYALKLLMVAGSTVLWLLMTLHIHITNKILIRRGTWDRVVGSTQPRSEDEPVSAPTSHRVPA